MAIECFYVPMVLRKVTEVPDGIGGSVLTFADSSIDGLITLAGSSEQELANKLNIVATHSFYCAVSVDVERQDQVIWDGDMYQVVSKPQNTVGRNHHFKTLVKQVLNE